MKFPDRPRELYAPISYALEEGGKRIRPLLVLMTHGLYSGNTEEALPLAAAVEMFHNFTLLHDDIMDNADMRRGKLAVHKKWDSNAAILSGDAMVICAYGLLRQMPEKHIPVLLDEFTKMSLEVCEGQQYDMNFENREDVTLEEYKEMIRLKTAVIFGASAKMGAVLGGAPEKDSEALYRFGVELGIAFQLQDDYLDTYGTPEVLGKAIGGDIIESKKTFLTITALNEAGGATRRAMLATFKDSVLPEEQKINRMKTIYDSLDVPGITRKVISRHIENASAELDSLSVDESEKAELKDIINTLAVRNK